jgi:lysozyme
MALTPSKKVVAASAATAAVTAAVISATTPFLAKWEGTDLVAVRDPIGTGHPTTYCHGQTSEFGKVKVGTRFTPAQCDALLAKSLPTYLTPLQKCVKREVPVKVMAALLDAAYNAGPGAVCGSPMVRLANAGSLKQACAAFKGWYVRSDGKVRQGLINRRNSEAALCLEGVAEGLLQNVLPPKHMPWWQKWAQRVAFWHC